MHQFVPWRGVSQVSFCNLGVFEYVIGLDKGIQNDFWNGKLNLEACSRRVDQVQIEPLVLALTPEGRQNKM